MAARARDREGKSGCLATSHLVRSQPATRPATLLRSLLAGATTRRRAEGNGAPLRSVPSLLRFSPAERLADESASERARERAGKKEVDRGERKRAEGSSLLSSGVVADRAETRDVRYRGSLLYGRASPPFLTTREKGRESLR